MDPLTSFPYCAPAPSDLIPLLVIAALFLLASRLVKRRKKKRISKTKK